MPILQRNPSLPPRLDEVVDAALREEPQITFQMATAFKEALEAVPGTASSPTVEGTQDDSSHDPDEDQSDSPAPNLPQADAVIGRLLPAV